MQLKHCQAWIFDMDGTLTYPIHDFVAIRNTLGIAPNTPILEAIAKMPVEQGIIVTEQLDRIELELAAQATVQPHAHELLHQLLEQNKLLGILTRNSEKIAAVTLAACGLASLFPPQSIIGRETCTPKPDPAGVRYLLNMWAVDQQQAVIVGDYLYDIEAGYRAGIKTVHLDRQGFFQWPHLMDHGISCLSELRSLID